MAIALQPQIKKIAREHTGKDGRKGAIFKRGGTGEGFVLKDLSKMAIAEQPTCHRDNDAFRWEFTPLMTHLASDADNVVEWIPPE